MISLTAIPDPGYEFTSWNGDLSSSSNLTTITMNGSRSVQANFAPVTAQYWKGEYFANTTLIRDEFLLYLYCGMNAPDDRLPADNFSARWTRSVYFPAGLYHFHLRHDDGGRMYIDGSLKINW